MYLHDRAGTLASIYIKLKSRPSVRHTNILAMSTAIEMGPA